MEDEITIQTLRLTAESVEKQATNQTKLMRIPPKLYQAKPDAYTPLLISVGPFHHIGDSFNRFKDVNILAMEGKKRLSMLQLLEMTSNPEETLQNCKNLLGGYSNEMWRCYSEEIDVPEEQLVKIMVVDSCFLLLLLLYEIDHDAGSNNRWYCDPMILALRRDLALLENQLPFFVLQGLLHIIPPHYLPKGDGLSKAYQRIICNALYYFRLTPEIPQLQEDALEFTHLVHLISKCHQPSFSTQVLLRYKVPLSRGIYLRNATQLKAAGVTFQCKRKAKLLDLEFVNGILNFPPMVIHDCTETILINLLAYEHLSPHAKEYFTSHVMFMNHLIQSKEDLQLLERHGIIINELGSREDASKIFSNISKLFLLKDFCHRALCEQIEAYADSRRRRYIVDLKRRYLNSPWALLSLIAAIMLLGLTMLQTIYTMFPYYQHRY